MNEQELKEKRELILHELAEFLCLAGGDRALEAEHWLSMARRLFLRLSGLDVKIVDEKAGLLLDYPNIYGGFQKTYSLIEENNETH